MNHLNVTKDTSEREIAEFCENNPLFCRKTITAQARFERRKKRSEHNRHKQELEDGNYEERTRPQYRLSIFDRNRS